MKTKEEKIGNLAAFVNILERSGIHKFNPEDFISRLRMQKYVYLARFFGFDLGYEYNLYLRGPYSPALAEDYYRLKEKSERVDLSFFGNFDKFAKLVRGKDHRWLEIASTIHFIWENNRNCRERYREPCKDLKAFVINRTSDMKSHVGRPFIEGVFEELEKAALLKN
ncbi:MAG: hypothetical protein EFT35_08865 [Methanophagales archaeon ANME-1-THS]|nr:MAG: hypothetical protein EFT35_08865 [Methanophagales archaeon ANME-1-THS]